MAPHRQEHLRHPSIELSTAELDAEIQDKSDSDIVTKSLAVAQSAFLIIQSVARYSVGLRLSELELATLGFIVCALVMTGFWWDKPFNVQSRYVVGRPADDHEFQDRLGVDQRVENLNDQVENFMVPEKIDIKDIDTAIGAAAFYITGGSFAGIHMCAWNWTFPSQLIQTLWRVFSLATLIVTFLLPLLMPLVNAFSNCLQDRHTISKAVGEGIIWVVLILILALYVVSRLGILVLTFYCFSSMPETVYTRLDWTGFIPHFS